MGFGNLGAKTEKPGARPKDHEMGEGRGGGGEGGTMDTRSLFCKLLWPFPSSNMGRGLMGEIRYVETMRLLDGICRDIILPGLLRCEMDFVHPHHFAKRRRNFGPKK